jgi:polyphosphate glucokinase
VRAKSRPVAERWTVGQDRVGVATRSSVGNVLVVDVGGTSVKILATGQSERRRFASGPTLKPQLMVTQVKKLAADWRYEAVSLGYPGPVLRGRPVADPYNLGRGWVGFDFGRAFGCPVKVVNDAAMQALGSYRGGKMLFLGLGTGLGTAMVVDGIVEPMELGHLPYKKSTYEDYVGEAGLRRHGKKKWRRHVTDVVARLIAALEPDDTVIGGGNVAKLKTLPPRCRAGDNANAFLGGFRLWEDEQAPQPGRLNFKQPQVRIRKDAAHGRTIRTSSRASKQQTSRLAGPRRTSGNRAGQAST